MKQFEIVYCGKHYLDDKNELKEMLKCYKGILSTPIFEYLNSLIELEFSVIKNNISDVDRNALSELEIYKKVAIYNIYNRALSMFKQSDLDIRTDASLNVYAPLSNDEMCPLFKFQYGFDSFNYAEKMWVGDIHLYQTLEDKEKRKKELDRIMDVLEKLYDEKNPYHWYDGQFSSPSYRWEIDQMKKIKKYEEKFKILDSKKELTKEEEKEIEITNKFYELLLEDFGLIESDFEEDTINKEEKSYLNKTLVRIIPNICIQNNIKYI